MNEMNEGKKIPNDKMTFAEVLQDGLFVKKGDVIAFLDPFEYDKWCQSSNKKVLQRLTVNEVQKRFGKDFIVLMSNDARCDRHVMSRFEAEKFVAYFSSETDNRADFFRNVYQIKPTNFY